MQPPAHIKPVNADKNKFKNLSCYETKKEIMPFMQGPVTHIKIRADRGAEKTYQ